MLLPPPSCLTIFHGSSGDAIITPPWLGCSSLVRTMDINKEYHITPNGFVQSQISRGKLYDLGK